MIVVPPEGDPKTALIAVVGARPGDEEAAMGRPFIGPSGRVLETALGYAGLRRDQCYITNVVKTYDPNHPLPTMTELTSAMPALKAEINATNCRIILALGNDAMLAITDENRGGVEAWRGTFIENHVDFPGKKILVTYHPAQVAREPTYWWIFNRDIKRLVRPYNPPKRNLLLDPGLKEANDWLDGCVGEELSVDIEVKGNGVIDRIGLADNPLRAVCLNLYNSSLSDNDVVSLFRRLDSFFKTKKIIGQNIQFDVSRLADIGFRFNHVYFDTMLAHHLLWPELPHDLGFIVGWYTDEPTYKHTIKTARSRYNAIDAAATFEAKDRLLEELERKGQKEYFFKFVMPLLKPLMMMQNRGIKVDTAKLGTLATRLELEKDALQVQLDNFARRPINVRSTNDIQWLIHTVLQLPKTKLTKGGKPATDEETLMGLSYNSPHADVFKCILAIRERRTLKESFLTMDLDEEYRYHAAYKLHGTDSGRLSSVALREGPQLQNIPKAAKKVFIPADDCCFLNADLKRAEAMFVAFDSGDSSLMDIFRDPARDLYREVAAQALGLALKDVEPWHRQLFKKVTHACHYDMGDFRFVAVLKQEGIYVLDLPIPEISFDDFKLLEEGNYADEKKFENAFRRKNSAEKRCAFLRWSYFRDHLAIRRWQRKIEATVKETRELHDAFGRRRVFLGRMDKHLVKSALSFRPQASIVTVANQALIQLEERKAPLLAQTHDSITLESSLRDLERDRGLLEEALGLEIQSWNGCFKIPLEVSLGVNWGELAEWTGEW